ncbi:MAG: class I SAM-dependent methyltransferase [Candidatus Aminicenantia bacterium]
MSYYRIFSKFYERAAKKMCRDCQEFIEKGAKILDLGCGSGIIGREFENFFEAKLIGIDIRDQRIEKIPFRIFNGLFIPLPENSFDVILLNYVLHHADDPISLLKEAKRVAKRTIIFEDLPEGFFSRLRCYLHQVSYNAFFQRKRKTLNFKTKREWGELFEKLGLKIVAEKKVLAIKLDLIDPVYRVLFVLENA